MNRLELIFLCMFIPLIVFADESTFKLFLSPGQTNAFTTQEDKVGNYKLVVQLESGQKIVAVSDLSSDDLDHVVFNNFGNHMVGITFACGSPCYNTKFINLKTGQISTDWFSLPMAVDVKYGLVAYPDDDKGEIIIANIFDSNKNMIIKRSFSPVGSLVISEKVVFLADKPAIKLSYLEGENYKCITEIIPLDYKKLGVSLP